jgi:hypothetical protein
MSWVKLFNHFVCECEQCGRHVQPERLRSLQIEGEVELWLAVRLGVKGRSTTPPWVRSTSVNRPSWMRRAGLVRADCVAKLLLHS